MPGMLMSSSRRSNRASRSFSSADVSVLRVVDLEALAGERDLEDAANLRIVVHDEDAAGAHLSPSSCGRETTNSVPVPGALRTRTVPRCASAICRTMARPMPVPGSSTGLRAPVEPFEQPRLLSLRESAAPALRTVMSTVAPPVAAIWIAEPAGEYLTALSSSWRSARPSSSRSA